MTAGVYLLHFHTKYYHAQHYIGYSPNIEDRLLKHLHGDGARLMQVIGELGIPWEVAFIWPGADRNFERRIKNQHNAARLCPLCRRALQMSLWEALTPPMISVSIDFEAIQPIAF